MAYQASEFAAYADDVKDPVERCVLFYLGVHADQDGRGAFPSIRTISERIGRCWRTVHRAFKRLESRGLIRRGNQALAQVLPRNRRPVVWDLVMDVSERKRTKNFEQAKRRHGVTKKSGVTPAFAVTGSRETGTYPPVVTEGELACGSAREESMTPSPDSLSKDPVGAVAPPAPPSPFTAWLPDDLAASDLAWTSAEEPRCLKHQHLAQSVPCRACGNVREEFQRREEAAKVRTITLRTERNRQASECSLCDEYGHIMTPSGVIFCTHDPEHPVNLDPAPKAKRKRGLSDALAAKLEKQRGLMRSASRDAVNSI